MSVIQEITLKQPEKVLKLENWMEQYAMRDGGHMEAQSWGVFYIQINASLFYLLTVSFSHDSISKVNKVCEFCNYVVNIKCVLSPTESQRL